MRVKNMYYREHADSYAVLEDHDGGLYRWILKTGQIVPAPHEPRAGLIAYSSTGRELQAKALRAMGHSVTPDTPQARYDAGNTVQVKLKLNTSTDADILAALAAQPNKQGYIKRLIREDIHDKS